MLEAREVREMREVLEVLEVRDVPYSTSASGSHAARRVRR
jgi:hypothetical protein